MLIIPELQTVLLQPPRTGTSSVKDAVLKCYPESFLLYRHMEYAGIPVGYERWRIIAQVRDPFDRMRSLFNYMSNPEPRADTDPVWLQRVRADTLNGFDDWLTNGTYVFANPVASDVKPFRPKYNCCYPMVEQRKSQSFYAANADALIRFENLVEDVKRELNISAEQLRHRGKTDRDDLQYSEVAIEHMQKWHAWDIDFYARQSSMAA